MTIIINGAGIAGPTLAYWLAHFGFEPILVEKAPEPRTAGYVIDFWGVGYDIAEKMGLLPDVLRHGYRVESVRLVDRRGKTAAGFPVDVFRSSTGGRFTSLPRGELSAAVFRAIEGKVETVFSDGITGLEPHGDRMRVTFARGVPRECDLVIGADGLHSAVRRIVFGPQDQFERHLGYWVAAFEATGYRPRDELVYVTYARPGREVARFALHDDRTLFLFVFRSELAGPDPQAGGRETLHRVFGEAGWECPQILAELDACDSLYFDRVSQIRMDPWTEGRVALVGDAAFCASLLAGEGAGLAMAAAYVLAGELYRAEGDYRTAFTRYEQLLRPFILVKQRSAAKFASWFAPRTALGLVLRNFTTRLMSFPPVAEMMLAGLRDDIALPNYGR